MSGRVWNLSSSLLLFLASEVASECSLPCQNGGTCVSGEATFQAPTNSDGTAFDFLETKSVNGNHCACPTGWTGVLCSVPFDTCDNTNHPCYNGGVCRRGVLDDYGNEQFYCDCGNAVGSDGTKYVGQYCEHPVKTYCGDDQSQFCLNGGKCNTNYPASGIPCNCFSGFSGPNCQYASGTVPDCDLPCVNGGHCSLDTASNADEVSQYLFWADPTDKRRCICPEGWDGRLCDVPKIPCGDHHCFYGGSCLSQDIDGQATFHCDCTTSYTDTASYAGRFCQYPATSYCAKSTGLQGHLFCCNNGTCKADAYGGCDCPSPYTGFSCEFISEDLLNKQKATGGNVTNVPGYSQYKYDDDWIGHPIYDKNSDTSCTLTCMNNGVCRVGVKDVGFVDGIGSTDPALNASHEDFMHCVCPDGFYGLHCENPVAICGEGKHLCLYGGNCIADTAQAEQACDCTTAGTDIANTYAGDYCQHPVNDICSEDVGYDATPLSFCVNGGACKKRVTAEEAHPGCDCPSGWLGPHCEIREGNLVAASRQQNGSPSAGYIAFEVIVAILSVMAVIVVSAYAFTYYNRRRKRRNRRVNTVSWAASYRDEPSNAVNLAPRRMSYSVDDTYPVSEHSSSRDPFATHLPPNSSTISEVVGDDQPDEFEDDHQPEIYIGPPRDEDGHELHNVEII